MGHQIIQQPDGRLCVFSSIVDEIVIFDATPEALIEYYRDTAADEAEDRVRRIIDKVTSGNARKAYYQFTMTYDEAMEKNRDADSSHGEEFPKPQAGRP